MKVPGHTLQNGEQRQPDGTWLVTFECGCGVRFAAGQYREVTPSAINRIRDDGWDAAQAHLKAAQKAIARATAPPTDA